MSEVQDIGPGVVNWTEKIYSVMEAHALQADLVNGNRILRDGYECIVVSLVMSMACSDRSQPVATARFQVVRTLGVAVYDEVWRTQDGRELRVCDMSDDHVRATLNMLLRNRRKRRELKLALKQLSVWQDGIEADDAKWGKS